MKVLSFNGSHTKEGNTHNLIQILFTEFNKSDIEPEEININRNPVKSCLSYYKCMQNLDKKCLPK